jgi:cellulose synthase operon protein C
MPTGSGTAPLPTSDCLSRLATLYHAGRYLDAHVFCQSLAPLEAWQGTPASIMAGRLASQWGDEPLSHRLHQQTYRADPADWSAIYYKGQTVWGKHGVFEALQFVRPHIARLPLIPETRAQSYVWLLYARLLGIYRDFTAADALVDRNVSAFPEDPWVWVDKADYLEQQDRYEEALAAAEQATRIQPWYRPAIQARAHLLQLLERDREAIALLHEAQQHVQSGRLVQMLVSILEENGRFEELPPLIDRVETLLPMPDASERRWLSGRRCFAAHRRGESTQAVDWARKNGSGYFKKIAENLEKTPAPGRRVHLPVGFIRQHYMTCAPATLTALSQYWGRAADHQAIARAICYDGSPDHLERDWSESNGWLVREFRPTWEVACQLLDRGCPFAIVTVETDSAHMQAVIGYDASLRTLLIRDPYYRHYREWLADGFTEAYAAHGPRAMLMLPPERASLLDGITLPDAALYDQYYRLRRALHIHERAEAEAALMKLKQIADNHLLTLWGGYELAHYDGRLGEALELVAAIRQKHPADGNWRLAELRLRERLGDQVAHRKFLHEAGAERTALAAIRREYAEDLTRDARRHHRTHLVLRSLLRRQSTDPQTVRAYANLLWTRRNFAEATFLYRLAACRADKVEYHWDSYFSACRHLGQTEEALALLRNRVTRWGTLSSQPARTLFDSLNALDRTNEGIGVLAEARQLRPDDGELLLFTAEALSRFGQQAEAAGLLEDARPRAARPLWLRAAARIADYCRDHPTALSRWRELAELNPADTAAQSAVARLLAITEGEAAAVRHLRAARELRPHSLPLHQLLVERLRAAPAAEALTAVEEMLVLDLHDAWALREKALILRRLQRLEEALACAETAVHIAPNTPSSHGVRADVLADLGRTADAHQGYRTGLILSIDADWLFERLIETCPDFVARQKAVTFLHQELMRQNSLDHACLQFRITARNIVNTGELTAMLRAYHAANPEVWAAWSALVVHLLEAGQTEQAEELARTATERFPLVPRAWTDLARVYSHKGDALAEIGCIEKALAINPAWALASRQLSAAHERLMQLDAAEHALRRAVAANPLESANHAFLADVLWRRRNPREAVAEIEAALNLNPDYGWAWERLDEWSRELGEPDRARRFARHFTTSRAGEAGSWLRLVRMHFHEPDLRENLAALDRAAALTPLDTEPWDLRANLLAEHLHYDEALAACRPPVFGDRIPHVLEGRAAWINHRRGRTDEAISQIRTVLERHPDYRWGWAQLTEWLWDKELFEEIRAPAEKWAWLDPQAAPPHGYLALAHQKAGRRKEAKDELARAISLDAQYGYGVAELLRMHLEDGEFDPARAVIKHYATHYPEWETLRAEIRLHIAAKDRDSALITLRRFGQLPAAAATTFNRTADLLFETGWAEVVENALAPLLADNNALPAVGDLWIKARQKQERVWSTFGRLLLRQTAPVHRPGLLGAFVAWLGEKNFKWRLRLAVLWWSKELRRDPECWGQVGYALATCKLNRHTAWWLRDWNRREPAPAPWMLSNLVLAMQCLGRHQQAVEVLDRALALPADHVREKLLGWRACEHALAGDAAGATKLLDKINQSAATEYHKTILLLVRLLIEVQTAPPAGQRSKVDEALIQLREKIAAYPSLIQDQALRRLYRRTLDQFGRATNRHWLRIRSRLPLFVPSRDTSSSDSDRVPWWLVFLVLMAVSNFLRSCS